MLKTTSKFQGVLKMFMLGMFENRVEKCVDIPKNHHHTLRVEIKW